MHRIFHNAKRRIDAAEDDVERRRILKLLGDAALEEHAEWILMHRERSIDQKESSGSADQRPGTADGQSSSTAPSSATATPTRSGEVASQGAGNLSGAEAPRGRETEFGPVPERLAPVFRDRDELATATNLGETLTRALRQSANQVVICSPAAAKSRWVNEEILTYKRLGREHRVFCLIVGGEPGDPAQECFPPLSSTRWARTANSAASAANRSPRTRRSGKTQTRRQAEAHRRHAGCRTRRVETARGASPPRPHDDPRGRIGRWHGDHLDARCRCLVRAQRGGAAARAR